MCGDPKASVWGGMGEISQLPTEGPAEMGNGSGIPALRPQLAGRIDGCAWSPAEIIPENRSQP